jgi:hypothetical protein
MHAMLVPMAVPESCSQWVLSNWKTFMVIMSLTEARIIAVGKLGGRSSVWRWNHFWRVSRQCGVLMFVYIETASAVTNAAVGGRSLVQLLELVEREWLSWR